MRVRILALSCLAIACSLAFGEVKIVVVQETPIDSGTHPKLIVVVQENPIDPEAPAQRTFDIDDPMLSSNPFSGNSPRPLGGFTLSPPRYAISESPAPKLWSPFLPVDPLPPVFLNPLGDRNGDGPPDIGMSTAGAADPPTIVWARQVGRGNHDPVFARFVDGAWTDWTLIASNPAEDLDPVLLQAPDATIHAVWRRIDSTTGSGGIRYAARGAGEASFATDEPVSAPGEQAGTPTMALGPTGELLVAYATAGPDGSRQIVVAIKASAADSFQGQVIAATTFSNANPVVHVRCGHTWLVWTESASQVAYKELSDGLWSAPTRETHDASVSDGKVRMAVQTEICRAH